MQKFKVGKLLYYVTVGITPEQFEELHPRGKLSISNFVVDLENNTLLKSRYPIDLILNVYYETNA